MNGSCTALRTIPPHPTRALRCARSIAAISSRTPPPSRPASPRSRRSRPEATSPDEDADAKPAGPNETLRVAVCGVNGRGMEHIQGWGKLKDARITTICDVDLNVTGKAAKAIAKQSSAPSRRSSRTSAGVLDDKSIDVDLDRHAQPLACPDDDLGLPGRQGRLRREAGQPQRHRRPADGRGRPQVQPDRPDRHPVPQPQGHPGRDGVPPLRQARQDLHGQGALLQAARLDRPQAGRARCRRASTTTSGSARPPKRAVQPQPRSTTTGTGSGTTATATSATRASTRWTWPAGAWARTSSPRPSWPPAAGSATPTTARRPTRSASPSSSTTASSSSRSAA